MDKQMSNFVSIMKIFAKCNGRAKLSNFKPVFINEGATLCGFMENISNCEQEAYHYHVIFICTQLKDVACLDN